MVTAGLRNIQASRETKESKKKKKSPCIVAIFVCSVHVVLYTPIHKLFLNIANFNITCSGNSMDTLESQKIPLTFKSYRLYDLSKAA